jgi:hypothetical protein
LEVALETSARILVTGNLEPVCSAKTHAAIGSS